MSITTPRVTQKTSTGRMFFGGSTTSPRLKSVLQSKKVYFTEKLFDSTYQKLIRERPGKGKKMGYYVIFDTRHTRENRFKRVISSWGD